MNKAFLIGRLTRDPELRYSSSNAAIVNFTIAVDRQYTNKEGQRETDFIRIVAYNKQAENIKKFVTKGSLVAVDGRIQTGSYDDKDRKYLTFSLRNMNVCVSDKNKKINSIPSLKAKQIFDKYGVKYE